MMTIEARIKRLERQNKVLKIGVIALLVVVIGCHLSGGGTKVSEAVAQQSGVAPLVEARAFHLVDETGRLRAMLAVTKGWPALTLATESGKPLAEFGGSPAGAIAAKYEYDPYGNSLLDPNDPNTSGPYAADNPFRFSTKYWDDETGLGYWGYRYYSPSLAGR